MEEFSRAVSLGPECRAKERILERFGRTSSPSCVFDWQVTPAVALLAYLRRDFLGMFERRDLSIEPGEWIVHNTRYMTRHPHEFGLGRNPEKLDRRYAEARDRHDYLCGKARSFFRDDVPTLFVFSHPVPAETAEEIEAEIRRMSPARRAAFVNPPESEIAFRNWRGNDEVWREILGDFAVKPRFTVGPLKPFLRSQMRRARRHLFSWAQRT